MRMLLTAAILLATIAGTATAQERKLVQVIEKGPNYLQFDETGAVRVCRSLGLVDGVLTFACTVWADPEPWSATASSSE